MQKRKKFSKGQMYALIRKWEASGQTQKSILDKEGISKSTFGYWRKKYLKEKAQPKSKEKFIPVKIAGENNTNTRPGVLELVYPNGVRIVCPADIEFSRLKLLIAL